MSTKTSNSTEPIHQRRNAKSAGRVTETVSVNGLPSLNFHLIFLMEMAMRFQNFHVEWSDQRRVKDKARVTKLVLEVYPMAEKRGGIAKGGEVRTDEDRDRDLFDDAYFAALVPDADLAALEELE